MSGEWEYYWKQRLEAKGYEMLSAEYDSAYGWTVLVRAPDGRELEHEARATVAIGYWIDSLRRAQRSAS